MRTCAIAKVVMKRRRELILREVFKPLPVPWQCRGSFLEMVVSPLSVPYSLPCPGNRVITETNLPHLHTLPLFYQMHGPTLRQSARPMGSISKSSGLTRRAVGSVVMVVMAARHVISS